MIATGKFTIDTKSKKPRFIYRIRNSVTTDIKITITHIPVYLHEYFNTESQTFKCPRKSEYYIEAKQAQEDLEEFSEFVYDTMNAENSASLKFSSKWLKSVYIAHFKLSGNKDTIQIEEEIDPVFIEFYNYYIEKNKAISNGTNGKNLAPKTIDGYNTMINYWSKFLNYFHYNDFRISEINLDVFEKFIQYQEEVCILNQSTIETNANKFKAVLSNAKAKRKSVSYDYSIGLFKYSSSQANMIYLNDDEIQRILELKLENESIYLETSRDWFIIQLFTGLRISDLFKLNENYFKHGNIEIKTKKTGALCVIPTFKPTQAILTKNKGKLPKKLAEQTYNKHIKRICELAHIDELIEGSLAQVIEHDGNKLTRKVKGKYPKYKLVASHTCRRSLFTNLAKQDIPLVNIAGLSGHSNIRTLENYIRTNQFEKAQAVKEKVIALGGMY